MYKILYTYIHASFLYLFLFQKTALNTVDFSSQETVTFMPAAHSSFTDEYKPRNLDTKSDDKKIITLHMASNLEGKNRIMSEVKKLSLVKKSLENLIVNLSKSTDSATDDLNEIKYLNDAYGVDKFLHQVTKYHELFSKIIDQLNKGDHHNLSDVKVDLLPDLKIYPLSDKKADPLFDTKVDNTPILYKYPVTNNSVELQNTNSFDKLLTVNNNLERLVSNLQYELKALGRISRGTGQDLINQCDAESRILDQEEMCLRDIDKYYEQLSRMISHVSSKYDRSQSDGMNQYFISPANKEYLEASLEDLKTQTKNLQFVMTTLLDQTTKSQLDLRRWQNFDMNDINTYKKEFDRRQETIRDKMKSLLELEKVLEIITATVSGMKINLFDSYAKGKSPGKFVMGESLKENIFNKVDLLERNKDQALVIVYKLKGNIENLGLEIQLMEKDSTDGIANLENLFTRSVKGHGERKDVVFELLESTDEIDRAVSELDKIVGNTITNENEIEKIHNPKETLMLQQSEMEMQRLRGLKKELKSKFKTMKDELKSFNLLLTDIITLSDDRNNGKIQDFRHAANKHKEFIDSIPSITSEIRQTINRLKDIWQEFALLSSVPNTMSGNSWLYLEQNDMAKKIEELEKNKFELESTINDLRSEILHTKVIQTLILYIINCIE